MIQPIKQEVFTLEMFQNKTHNGLRYILGRNPVRQKEIEETREKKRKSVEELISEKNIYLEKSKRASVIVACKAVSLQLKKLSIDKWLIIRSQGRQLILEEDPKVLAKIS